MTHQQNTTLLAKDTGFRAKANVVQSKMRFHVTFYLPCVACDTSFESSQKVL